MYDPRDVGIRDVGSNQHWTGWMDTGQGGSFHLDTPKCTDIPSMQIMNTLESFYPVFASTSIPSSSYSSYL